MEKRLLIARDDHGSPSLERSRTLADVGSLSWTYSLLVYGSVLIGIACGAALGYRRGHRALTVFLGPAIGVCMVITADTVLSRTPSVTAQGDAIVFALFYLAAFGFAALAGVILHRCNDVFD